MKRLSILVLAFAFMFAFSFGVLANGPLWTDNAGFDPATGEGWLRDAGTLEGWSDSNFETLDFKAQGTSEVVGIGVTVEGIDLDWEYPEDGRIGKGGEIEDAFDQRIDYTVVAFAEIPCVLKMNVFGNSGWAEGISIGTGSEVFVNKGLHDDGVPRAGAHFMLFDTRFGGVVDGDWNFIAVDAIDYAAGMAEDIYIHACDLWTADVWANVPFGFAVSSAGMGDFAGLADPLLIEMRYLERLGAGIVSRESDLPPYNGHDNDWDNDTDHENGVALMEAHGWAGDYVLDEDGVEVGQYPAGQNVHVNMQFRIPVTGAPAGRYQGEVTFSAYTI